MSRRPSHAAYGSSLRCIQLDPSDGLAYVEEVDAIEEVVTTVIAKPPEDVAILGAGPVVHLEKADVLIDVSGLDAVGGVGNSDGAELVVGKAAIDIDSGSEDSSSSSSNARSRSRGRRQQLGAAAAAAVVTASAPWDIEETEKVSHREVLLPTALAMEMQHAGGFVALMSDTGSVIGLSPQDGGMCQVKISGTPGSIAKTVWQLEQLEQQHAAAASAAAAAETPEQDMSHMEQLLVPASCLGAVSAALLKVRERCGGIMIAVEPKGTPCGAFVASIGPGLRADVLRAQAELEECMATRASTEA